MPPSQPVRDPSPYSGHNSRGKSEVIETLCDLRDKAGRNRAARERGLSDQGAVHDNNCAGKLAA